MPHILNAEIITERRIRDAREDYLDCFGNFVPDVLSDCAACFVSSGGAGLYTVCDGTVAAEKEETKDAVKENTSPAAEQPKTEVKETTKNEASNTAEEKETKAAEAAKPADGEYETSAEATGSMFRVISSRLIVKDGKLKASILLSGTGYDYLYTGTAAEAAAASRLCP